MARKRLKIHGYYFDGKHSFTLYVNDCGKIVMKKDGK